MNELLSKIIEAHGGLDRWNKHERLTATIVAGGEFWGMKGLTQDQDPRQATVWLHEERSTLGPFGDPDWHSDFTPGRVAILKSDGAIVAERDKPRVSFAGHEKLTHWDPLHLAYFDGYALWTYLSTPFLLTKDGVEVAEIEPWTEGRETWRVLRARFPETIATHSTVQDFFFGDDLLLRRHDYRMDVAGGFDAAHLVYDYIEADGIRLPTRRRAYTRGPDRRPNPDPLMVSIDISDVRLSLNPVSRASSTLNDGNLDNGQRRWIETPRRQAHLSYVYSTGVTRMAKAVYRIVRDGEEWVVKHDEQISALYATKKAAFEAAVGTIEVAIVAGHQIELFIQGGQGCTAIMIAPD